MGTSTGNAIRSCQHLNKRALFHLTRYSLDKGSIRIGQEPRIDLIYTHTGTSALRNGNDGLVCGFSEDVVRRRDVPEIEEQTSNRVTWHPTPHSLRRDMVDVQSCQTRLVVCVPVHQPHRRSVLHTRTPRITKVAREPFMAPTQVRGFGEWMREQASEQVSF